MFPYSITQRLIAFGAFTALAFVHQRPTPAADDLRGALSKAAKAVHAHLKTENENQIVVGHFEGPAGVTGGPGIAHILGEELQKLGVEVKRRSKIGISGEYKPVKEKDEHGDEVLSLQIQAKLKYNDGSVITDFDWETSGALKQLFATDKEFKADQQIKEKPAETVKKGVFTKTVVNEQEVAELMAVNIHHPPADLRTPARRQDAILDRIREPQRPHVNATKRKISAGAGSPFAIEILVHGKPKLVTFEDEYAFIDLHKEDIYAIRVYNEADFDVAVTIKIDGLSIFSFSELRKSSGDPLYSHYIIPKHSGARQIAGWHRRDVGADNFYTFKVTDYPQSAAGQLLNEMPLDLGTITVCFAAAWTPEEGPPPGEGSRGPADLGTGQGPPTTQKLTIEKRVVGVMRDCISVQYSKGPSDLPK